jgi:hypothetical protein
VVRVAVAFVRSSLETLESVVFVLGAQREVAARWLTLVLVEFV